MAKFFVLFIFATLISTSFKVSATDDSAKRSDTQLVIIFDDSSSMQGTKLTLAKRATHQLLNSLSQAEKVVNLKDVTLIPLNAKINPAMNNDKDNYTYTGLYRYEHGDMFSETSPYSQMKKWVNDDETDGYNLEAKGGTFLVEKIDFVNHLQFNNNLLVFIFTDGIVDDQKRLIESLNDLVTDNDYISNDKSVNVYYFEIDPTSSSNMLSNMTTIRAGRNNAFNFKRLKDVDQLAAEFENLGKSLICNSLDIKIHTAITDGKKLIAQQTKFTSILDQLEKDESDINQIQVYLTDLKQIEQGWQQIANYSDTQQIPAEFSKLLERYLDITQQIDVLITAEKTTRKIDTLFTETAKATESIAVYRKQAQEMISYIIGIQTSDTEFYNAIPDEVKQQVSALLVQLRSIEQWSNSFDSRLKYIEGRRDELLTIKATINKSVNTLYALPMKYVDNLLATKDGQTIKNAILVELAKKNMHLSNGHIYRNGEEIVLTGMHVWTDSNQATKSTLSGVVEPAVNVRNKGVIIDLQTLGGSSNGQPIKRFINDGLIIKNAQKISLPNWDPKQPTTQTTIFMNNGKVLTVPTQSSLIKDYFWIKKDGKYIIFNKDLDKVQIITREQVKQAQKSIKGSLKILTQKGIVYLQLAGLYSSLGIVNVTARFWDKIDSYVKQHGVKDDSGRLSLLEANKSLLLSIDEKTANSNWLIRQAGTLGGTAVFGGLTLADKTAALIDYFKPDKNQSLLTANLELYDRWISHQQVQLITLNGKLDIDAVYLPIINEIIEIDFR